MVGFLGGLKDGSLGGEERACGIDIYAGLLGNSDKKKNNFFKNVFLSSNGRAWHGMNYCCTASPHRNQHIEHRQAVTAVFGEYKERFSVWCIDIKTLHVSQQKKTGLQ